MAQFASDAFGGSSGDTLQTYSASWVKNTGGTVSDAFISNAGRSRMGVTGSPAAVYYHTATPGSANYTVACDIVQKSAAGTNLAGVTGRGSTNAFTFYHAAFTDGTGWRLWRVVANAFTQLGSTTAQTLTNDQAYALVLDMNGTTIRMVRDGTQLVSATDSNISQVGKAGIRHFGSTSQSDTVGIHLDNWVATDDTAAGNTIAVPAGSLTLTGNAPTVVTTANQRISVPAGALTLTGNAPTVTATAGQTIQVPAGSLTLTGNAPTVSKTEHQRVSVPAGSLTLTGNAPAVIVDANQRISVPAGALTLTGNAPTVATTTHQTVAVPAGSLNLIGYAPTVSNGEAATTTAPSGVRKRRPRVYVEIDDQLFPVNSDREAQELLAKAKQTAREVVKQVRANPTAPKVEVPIVTVRADEKNERLEAIAAQAQQYIAEQYKKAQAIQRAREDDEDVELLLLSL